MGKLPHKKGSASQHKHARVGRGIHGQTSGPRILHDAHDETEQEIWLLQRETKHLPRVAREESGGGGKGRFVLLDWKKPTYVIPEGLNEFTLKAYVAKGVTK